MLDVRSVMLKDLNYLMDIDLKSYDYPLPIEKWRELANDMQYVIQVAIVKNEPVGFAVYHRKQDEAEILRIAVKLDHRNKGIGTELLLAVEGGTSDLNKIVIIVPEVQCFPGHNDDVSTWLLNNGYIAVPPIIKDYIKLYGQDVDGFKFMKENYRSKELESHYA